MDSDVVVYDEIRAAVEAGSGAGGSSVFATDGDANCHWEEPLRSLVEFPIRAGSELKDFTAGSNPAFVIPRSRLHCLQFQAVGVFITLFEERGIYSNHVYQPEVNHREIVFDHFNFPYRDEEGKNMPPLMKSTLWPESDKEQFDFLTAIGLYFCETIDSTDYDEAQLADDNLLYGLFRSHGQLRLDGEEHSRFAYIRNRYSKPMTVRTLKRTLLVFGYKWSDPNNCYDDDDSIVQLRDISAFFNLFADYNLGDAESFQKFLVDFNMGSVYNYDATVSTELNVWRFGHLIRVLSLMRVAAFDGQHRLVSLAQSSVGIHFVGADVPLKVTSIECALPDIKLKPESARSQVWRKMTFTVATPEDPAKLGCNRDIQIVYAGYGSSITGAQDMSIKTGFHAFTTGALRVVLKRMVGERVEAYTFANYWSKNVTSAAISSNLSCTWNAFVHYSESEPARREYVLSTEKSESASANVRWAKLKSKTGPNFIKLISVMHSKGAFFAESKKKGATTITTSTRPGLSHRAGYLLSLLKACSASKGAMDLLNEMFRSHVPRSTNMFPRSTQLPYHEFHSIRWLGTYVVEPVTNIYEHLCRKFYIEMRIAKLLNRIGFEDTTKKGDKKKNKQQERVEKYLNKTDDLREALETLEFHDIPFTFPPDDKEISKTGMKVSHLIVNKVEYAIYATLITDVLEFLNKYGYDPLIEQKGEQNRCLNAYCR